MTRTHRPAQRSLRRARRIDLGILAVVVAGLLATLTTLSVMGTPPSLRIDSLWVHARQTHVRIALVSAGIAGVFSLLLLVRRRYRMIGLLAWMAASGVIAHYFGKTVTIVAHVLWNRVW